MSAPQAWQWDGTAEGAGPIINAVLTRGGNATYRAKGELDYDLDKAYILVSQPNFVGYAPAMLVGATDFLTFDGKDSFHVDGKDAFAE